MTPVLVADASVIVKWLLPGPEPEQDVDVALSLLSAFRRGQMLLRQPPHWLAEVAAVLTRLSPRTVDEDVADLYAMRLDVLDSVELYQRASRLAKSLDQHLFDTLYHAVALETPGAMLVTADERYYRKAASAGAIALLSHWPAELPRGT